MGPRCSDSPSFEEGQDIAQRETPFLRLRIWDSADFVGFDWKWMLSTNGRSYTSTMLRIAILHWTGREEARSFLDPTLWREMDIDFESWWTWQACIRDNRDKLPLRGNRINSKHCKLSVLRLGEVWKQWSAWLWHFHHTCFVEPYVIWLRSVFSFRKSSHSLASSGKRIERLFVTETRLPEQNGQKSTRDDKGKMATMCLVVQIASNHFWNLHFPFMIRSVRTFPQQNCACRNRSSSKLLLKSRMEKGVDSRKILFKKDRCCFVVSIGNESNRAEKWVHSTQNLKWHLWWSVGDWVRFDLSFQTWFAYMMDSILLCISVCA